MSAAYPFSGLVLPNDRTEQRQQALKALENVTWPNKKMENWRYTDISHLKTIDWNTADTTRLSHTIKQRAHQFKNRLVFFNGLLQSALSPAIDGLDIAHPPLRLSERPQKDALSLLSQALTPQHCHFRIQHDIDEPIHLVLVECANQEQTLCQLSVELELNRECQATLVVHNWSELSNEAWSNRQLALSLHENAQLTLINDSQAASTFTTTTKATVQTGASLRWHDVKTACRLDRDQIDIDLNGERASFHFNALTLGQHHNVLDNTVSVAHNAPHTKSEQFHLGLADDHSRLVFDSTVNVAQNAVQADSQQSTRNMILASTATVNAKPTLVIHNDDVQCSHGATIGDLDKNALFYLQSRGLSETAARNLLLGAFVRPFLTRLKSGITVTNISSDIEATVAKQLEQMRASS